MGESRGVSPFALAAALTHLTEGLPATATVRAPDGRLLAAVGPPLDVPTGTASPGAWLRGGGPGLALRLPDGRSLLLRGTARPPCCAAARACCGGSCHPRPGGGTSFEVTLAPRPALRASLER